MKHSKKTRIQENQPFRNGKKIQPREQQESNNVREWEMEGAKDEIIEKGREKDILARQGEEKG